MTSINKHVDVFWVKEREGKGIFVDSDVLIGGIHLFG